MAKHVCQCRNCHPEHFPSGPRQGPDHISMRFQEDREEIWTTAVTVLFDGQEVQHVSEALAGPNGFVVHFCDKDSQEASVHACVCKEGACEEVLHGNVEIKKAVRAT